MAIRLRDREKAEKLHLQWKLATVLSRLTDHAQQSQECREHCGVCCVEIYHKYITSIADLVSAVTIEGH